MKGELMRISAIIPTYNRRAHTFRAIDSVLAQTLPVEEIIVVDDGSTDGTAEAIRSHYGSRVVVLTQENAGVSAARNRGIRAAHGKWLAFLDSDDVWLPEKLARQAEALSVLGSGDFGACFTDCVFEGNASMSLSAFKMAGLESSLKFCPLADPISCLLSSTVIFVQGLLVRHSLMEELGGFDEAMVISEDTDVLFRLGLKTKFCFVSEPLVRIDRTLSRSVGLCELYHSREDRIYDGFKRMYSSWLSLPGIRSSKYERQIRERLCSVRYDSAIIKARQLRIVAALREIRQAKLLENSYGMVLVNLFARISSKLLSKIRRNAQPGARSTSNLACWDSQDCDGKNERTNEQSNTCTSDCRSLGVGS
jgi:glycosyltransferase involved in cell wall biosynthesis